MKKLTGHNSWWVGLISFLSWSLVFGIAYGQSPLYTSNQNTYFLHGLAHAGVGLLSKDWLANTVDPLPIFSLLVQVTYSIFKSGIPFYFYYSLLLGIYLISMVGLADITFGIHKSKETLIIFLVVFIGIHSAVLHYVLSRFTGQPFLFEGGVANQRILGQVLQPSSFGVFLVFSIYLFLRNQKIASLIALTVAVSFHSVYLLTAAVMVIGYMWILYKESKSLKTTMLFGCMALLFVLPIFIYTAIVFKPTSPELTQQANDILVNFRIPHHTLIALWLSWSVGVQVAIILAAFVLIRNKRIFPFMVVLFTSSVVLTLVQAVTKNETLALLYPWRISVVIVPIATCLLLGFAISKILPTDKILPNITTKLLSIVGLISISIFLFFGATRLYLEMQVRLNDPSKLMQQYIKENKKPTDVYLIPVKMINFRLDTGAPIFIDRSIPYDDVEVVQWYDRFKIANYFYQTTNCKWLSRLENEGVNKVIIPINVFPQPCPGLIEIYADAYYQVYSVGR